ncbi:AAA family ATPase [Sporomusa sphaeroides]|uniref:AAA family ATPase n=1 Tax=Sporomusa sphaeroides TaxID=47679 RepID=UPI002BF78209|nr:AAA family ATPase [Sporomusa sphaeroides]HML33957.1 AAA family ATPase [Sporomusa sphaeroides]
MSKLRAVMFGTPAIYWNANKVIFPFAKMEAMLYYLLVTGETTREKLATLFWGEMEDTAAKKNLRNTIYLIKKMLSPELLITPTRTTISVNPNLIQTTEVELLNKLELKSFLSIYHGDFLEGFYCKDTEGFDEWVILERGKFKEKITGCLTKSIVNSMQDKDYVAAKQYINYLIKIDEYNESAYRVLMRIYESEGAFYKVLAIYYELKKKFAEELNLQLSAKTQEIYNRVKEKRVVKTKVPEFPKCWFFGRDKEVQVLCRVIENFCLNRRYKQMVLLQGEEGVGKTTIIKHLFENTPRENFCVLWTQCYQAESGYSYKSWSSIFLQIMNLLRKNKIVIPPLWHKVISYIFPATETGDTIDNRESFMMAYEFNPTMVEEIMCGVLGKLAKHQRIIIVIDDIHWMDSQGFSVLHQVLRIHGGEFLCIATCHTEHVSRIEKNLWNFERDEFIEKMIIERFNLEEVAELMAVSLPADTANSELQHKLYDYTGGNALFLMECMNLLEAGQELSGGSLRMQGVLKERIGNLSINARKVLEVASIFFKDSGYTELLNISKMDEFELVEAIEELTKKKLIVKTGNSGQQGRRFKFYNLQIQSFVYKQLSSPRRELLHKCVGLELERQVQSGSQTKDIYEAILYHYTQADEKIKVLEYTVKLAEKYFCPQYELFPELTEYYPAGYAGFKESHRQTIGYLEKIEELLQIMATEKADDEQLALYKIAYWEMMGRHYIWSGEHLLGIKMIHQLLRLASVKGIQDYLLKGCQQMVFFGIQVNKPSIVKKYAEKLLQIAEEANLTEKKAMALRFMGIAAALRHEPEQAERYYRQSIGMFKKLAMHNNRYSLNIAAAYNYIGNLRRDAHNLEEALTYYEQAVKFAGHKRSSEGVAVFYVNAGYAAFILGDFDKAHQYMSEALAVGDGFGDNRGYWCSRSYCILYCVLAIIGVRENRCHEGRMYLNKADESLGRYHDNYQKGLVLTTKIEIRQVMDKNPVVADVFGDYLTLSIQEYYEQIRTIFNNLGEVPAIARLGAIALSF